MGSASGTHSSGERWCWPATAAELVELQHRLAGAAAAIGASEAWSPAARAPVTGGCFVAFGRGLAGPGHLGDRAWAAAVTWTPHPAETLRKGDRHLQGRPAGGRPRQADDVIAQAVVEDRVAAAYVPGLLALRQGPILGAAVGALAVAPDVMLVDATGLDHPRGAGLAVHVGAVCDMPTVGVTHRPLLAIGGLPVLRRGAYTPLEVDGRRVGYWVCTRTGVRPVVAHAGWRTTPETAVAVVLGASTEAARTPVPLHEARRVAREARALAASGLSSPTR